MLGYLVKAVGGSVPFNSRGVLALKAAVELWAAAGWRSQRQGRVQGCGWTGVCTGGWKAGMEALAELQWVPHG